MKFFFDKYDFTSGGAIAALTLGLIIKELWLRGWPAFGALEGRPFYNMRSTPIQGQCHTLQGKTEAVTCKRTGQRFVSSLSIHPTQSFCPISQDSHP